MLKDKQREITQIETDWPKTWKDILKSTLSLTDVDADKLARVQSKNKLALCLENGKNTNTLHPLKLRLMLGSAMVESRSTIQLAKGS